MAGTERQREIRRRRTRRAKLTLLAQKSKSADPTQKAEIARKLRRMTPGAEILIERWGLKPQA